MFLPFLYSPCCYPSNIYAADSSLYSTDDSDESDFGSSSCLYLCQVFCWRSSGGSVRQCRWAYPRQVFMSDIALSKNGMMFITPDGEGFTGVWAGECKKYGEKKGEECDDELSW